MRIAFGLALVAAGAIGTLVPIVPGLALVLAGIAVLGPHHRLSRALTRRWRAWSGKEELRQLEHDMKDDGRRSPFRQPAWRDDDDNDRHAPRRRWSDMLDIFD